MSCCSASPMRASARSFVSRARAWSARAVLNLGIAPSRTAHSRRFPNPRDRFRGPQSTGGVSGSLRINPVAGMDSSPRSAIATVTWTRLPDYTHSPRRRDSKARRPEDRHSASGFAIAVPGCAFTRDTPPPRGQLFTWVAGGASALAPCEDFGERIARATRRRFHVDVGCDGRSDVVRAYAAVDLAARDSMPGEDDRHEGVVRPR